MIRIPASAHLDPRWNKALDRSAALGVSLPELARAWETYGPDQVLVMLLGLAEVSDETGAA
jgi:hypothetical protein